MKKSILDDCLRDAKKRIHKHPEYENYMHWSFIIKDNKIISKGVNHNTEPHKKFGYHELKRGLDFRPKFHSELDSIVSSKRNVRESIMINIRLSKSGEIKTSLPCKSCRRILKIFGIKKCYFTTEYNWGYLTL